MASSFPPWLVFLWIIFTHSSVIWTSQNWNGSQKRTIKLINAGIMGVVSRWWFELCSAWGNNPAMEWSPAFLLGDHPMVASQISVCIPARYPTRIPFSATLQNFILSFQIKKKNFFFLPQLPWENPICLNSKVRDLPPKNVVTCPC